RGKWSLSSEETAPSQPGTRVPSHARQKELGSPGPPLAEVKALLKNLERDLKRARKDRLSQPHESDFAAALIFGKRAENELAIIAGANRDLRREGEPKAALDEAQEGVDLRASNANVGG